VGRKIADDLQLTLIIIVAVLVILFVTPFGVYRFFQGNYLVALSDMIMVIVVLISAIRAWRTRDTRLSGLLISFVCSGGLLVVAFSRGLEGAFWIYPLIMFVFYLSPPLPALLQVLFVTAVLAVRELFYPQAIFLGIAQVFSFLATVVTATAFSFLFAYRNRQHRSQLMHWATKDPLTGLDNRRGLEKELQFALSSRHNSSADWALLVMDLDNFKYINDTLGHAEGDRVLCDLAHLISSSIRFSDYAFRYGGDEFVILLSNISPHGLEEVCGNVLEKIRARLRCGTTPVTVSIGAALLGVSEDAEAWFLRADRCLYKSKEDGRNCYNIDFDTPLS
jgi:diguanylate cyclase